MSYTAVKRANGTSQIASNTILSAGGTPYVVSNDALDASAVPHTVFGSTVALTPVTILQFDLYDNRIFTL